MKKNIFLGILGFFGVIVLFMVATYAFGWFGVGYTKTVGKAQQNAQRQVFEETQSYVEGKRQEVTKYRLEYLEDKNPDDRAAIRATIHSSLANFDKSKLDDDLRQFVDSVNY